MSKSAHPSDMTTSNTPFAAFAGEMTEMQKDAMEWMASASVTQFPGAANLAAHPMAAMAAASAIGLGMASQMYGMFAGTMAGAMRAANMLANESTGGHSDLVGLANPLSFDLATGTFDDTKEPDTVAAKAPAKKKPAAKAVAAPVRAAPKKPATKKAEKAKPAEKPAARKTEAAPAKPEPVGLVEGLPEAPAAAAAVSPVLPEDFVKPKGVEEPDMPDDLKAISGIGPKLESVLNSLGIWTYAQIAAWTPFEIAWIDDYLQFKGRIERDGWIAQAAEFAKKA